MPLGRRAGHMILLLVALAMWAESVRGGSSFLSPAQKPGKGEPPRKPPRVGRRNAVLPETPLLQEDDNQIRVSAPFEVGVSMTETEFEEYGPALQRILLDILGDTPPAE